MKGKASFAVDIAQPDHDAVLLRESEHRFFKKLADLRSGSIIFGSGRGLNRVHEKFTVLL
jgi:hypothetical protein